MLMRDVVCGEQNSVANGKGQGSAALVGVARMAGPWDNILVGRAQHVVHMLRKLGRRRRGRDRPWGDEAHGDVRVAAEHQEEG